jgi:lysophospholipase L1-like esterase
MRTRFVATVASFSIVVPLAVGACGSTVSEPIAGDSPPSAPATNAPSQPSAPRGDTPGTTPDPGPTTATECFKSLTGKIQGPKYDQYNPLVSASCSGTRHQKIVGPEKLVFLGDSVTAGTPPTPSGEYYANQLVEKLKPQFGAIEVKNCAEWGATTEDFFEGKKELDVCFPGGVEAKKTLVVMTVGGNDIAGWRKARPSTQEAIAQADAAAARLRTAVQWLKDPAHFPNGSWVVFANVYEYTDTSGDLGSCPAATLGGVSGLWPEGAPAVVHLQEQFMKVAVDTKTDMVFLLEHFCGHGYRRGDASLQCYRGPNAALWFDLTCIHPNPTGHGEAAKLFTSVIQG